MKTTRITFPTLTVISLFSFIFFTYRSSLIIMKLYNIVVVYISYNYCFNGYLKANERIIRNFLFYSLNALLTIPRAYVYRLLYASFLLFNGRFTSFQFTIQYKTRGKGITTLIQLKKPASFKQYRYRNKLKLRVTV